MRTKPDAPPPSTSRVLQGLLVAIIAAYLLGVLTADLVRLRLPIPLPQIGGAPIDLVVQANALIQQNYVDKSAIDPQKMSYTAIRAMLETLGDRGHTQFLTPAERKFQQEALAGRFGGIGAEIAMQGDDRSSLRRSTVPQRSERASAPATCYSRSRTKTRPTWLWTR